MTRGLGAALCLALVVSAGTTRADPPVEILRFSDLKGWAADDHGAALSVFRETCGNLDAPDWAPLCALAETQTDARRFFELFFRPC